MCDPPLVLSAELVRTVDAAHPEHGRGLPVRTRVIEDILLGGSLRTTVGRVEIETAGFRYAALPDAVIDRLIALIRGSELYIVKPAVNLIGRCIDERRTRA